MNLPPVLRNDSAAGGARTSDRMQSDAPVGHDVGDVFGGILKFRKYHIRSECGSGRTDYARDAFRKICDEGMMAVGVLYRVDVDDTAS